MTDELDHVQPDDATAEPGVPEPIALLGIEAQAEYLRARQRLGLSDLPEDPLGTVGRYRLEREVGRGGMGIVYRARDPELDRPVAIKLVQAHPFVHYDKLRARMLREAKVLAKLTHPNVVRIYDFGEHQGEVYLAMEYVEGTTLRQWQREQTHRAILDAYVRAARGLAAAHELGITHRDFKPDNVLVADDGRVLVGDFGLAGVSVREEVRDGEPGAVASKGAPGIATRTGALLGTLTYMAPEQLRGEGATSQSDQFAYCVSLWEALSGKRPFEAETKEALLEEIARGQVVGGDRIARRLRGRLLRGLAVEPAQRFGGIEELVDAIRPRPSRVVIVVVFVLTLAAGLVIGLSIEGQKQESLDCQNLRASLSDIKRDLQSAESTPNPVLGPTYEQLIRHADALDEEINDLCRPRADDTAAGTRQKLGNWSSSLRETVEVVNALKDLPSSETKEELPAVIDYMAVLEEVRRGSPPPRKLDDEVNGFLKDAQSNLAKGHSQRALASIASAVASADGRELELAYAYRWRGRVLTLLEGKHEQAKEAYLEALTYADTADYDVARLEFELLIAEVAAMRLGDLARAEDSLRRASGILRRPSSAWLSFQQADYYEVMASVLKRRGAFGEALLHQARALIIRHLILDVREIANGYVNLGTIFELRGDVPGGDPRDLHLAGQCYQVAMKLLEQDSLEQTPEWLQAAFNYGHWLILMDKDIENAIGLLQTVGSQSNALRGQALLEIVMLPTNEEEALLILPIVHELEIALSNDQVIAEKRLEAWTLIARAYAMMRDIGAYETSAEKARAEALSSGALVDPQNAAIQTAMMDLTFAGALEYESGLACPLAVSARAVLVETIPDTAMQQIEEADRIIANTCIVHP